jgi:AsmA protein
MAIWKKLLIGAVALGIGILIVTLLLFNIYVTPDRVRNLVRTGLEESLRREVNLGAIEVGLFSGIQLEQLSIEAREGRDILFSAKNIELSYDFIALLRGELLFVQILINEPQLRLVREIDGRLNIDDLITSSVATGKADASEVDKPVAEFSAEIPLLIERFSLQGGTLQFIDRKLNPNSSYRYRLEKLDVDIEDFSLNRPFPVRLAANLNDSALAIDLQFALSDGLQALQLHVNQLNLVPFLPYLQDVLPGSLERGLLSTELQISKQPEGFVAQGQVVVDRLDIRLDLDNPVHWSEVRIALDQDLFYRPADQLVDVEKLHVDINSVQAGYRGKVLLADPPRLDGEGSLKVADLREIAALVPVELREQVAVYAVAGGLDATMQVRGQPLDFEVVRQASLKLSEFQASIGDLRPAFSGAFNYAQGDIRGEQLEIDLNGQLLLVDLEATKIMSSRPHLQLSISSERLNLDELLPQKKTSAPDTTATSGKGTAVKEKTVKDEPLVPPVDGRARVRFPQLLYQGLLIENVLGEAVLDDGELVLEDLSAAVAGGAVKLRAVAELAEERIPLRGHLSLSGIDLTALTDALWPDARGSISGTLVADSGFSGYGATDNISDNLSAAGNFDLKNGEITGSPLLAGLSRFLTNPELKVLEFSRLHGNYGLENRQGTINAKLESRRLSYAPKGTFSLDGPLDMAIGARIAPELMAKSGVGGRGAELLKDERGWSLLPLKVKGSYTEPRFTLDSAGMKKQLKQGAVKELGRQLRKKLGGEKDDQQSQQVQELLDGTLKKLFGN